MTLLSKLSPAETKLILEEGSASFKDLLKLTFMDLLLKKVIKIVEEEKELHISDGSRTYTYIEAGKNFHKYKPKPHETIFTTSFAEEDDIQLLFTHFVKIGHQASGNNRRYKKKIGEIGNLQPYLSDSFFISLFGMTRLNDRGKKTKHEVTKYLNEVDAQINDWLENDQEKALEILLAIGGNIFLLKNLNFELLKNIDKELLALKKKQTDDETDFDDYWFLYVDFYDDYDLFGVDFDEGFSFQSYFDDTLDSFDTQFDSFDSSSSFDSGCSSCSGCGGCGGCS
jgi:hypothetical protein